MTLANLFKIFVVLLLLLLGLTCYYQGVKDTQTRWDLAKATQEGRDASAVAELIQQTRLDEQEKARQMAEIDQRKYRELLDAQVKNKQLHTALASAVIRVRLPARCPGIASLPAAAGNTSLDTGAGSAELEPATAAALGSITDDGDRAIIKLNALKEICTSHD